MIRVFIGSALPILGLTMAAAFVGPELMAGPQGEPLVVAARDASEFRQTNFHGDACASTLLLAERSADDLGSGPVTRILALSVGPDGVAVATRDIPLGDSRDGTAIILVFDAAGRLLAAGEPSAAILDPAQSALMEECAMAHPFENGLI